MWTATYTFLPLQLKTEAKAGNGTIFLSGVKMVVWTNYFALETIFATSLVLYYDRSLFAWYLDTWVWNVKTSMFKNSLIQ